MCLLHTPLHASALLNPAYSSPHAPCVSVSYMLQRFLGQPEIPVETAVRVYRRYLQLEPTHAEEFIAYLKSKVRSFLAALERTHPQRLISEACLRIGLPNTALLACNSHYQPLHPSSGM